jgi:MerR family transcriptional regulator, thiopeptide resistance regulator
MIETLDIATVARNTGLTSRALRFYEARGLIAPLRTDSGRRVFGTGELARVHQLLTLKRAGLSLGQIKQLFDGGRIDLGQLLRAQIEHIDTQARNLAEARGHLELALSRIDRGEPLDAATLCSLIKSGENIMEHENWSAVSDRYIGPEAKADFAASIPNMPAEFDHTAYSAKWDDLSGRIEAALPMDPESEQARAFYDEWTALLAPFTAIATPAMTQGVVKMYDKIADWQAEQKPPFSAEVWAFIQSVGPAPMPRG